MVLALWAYAVALSLFVLFLLARAPWKHHRQVVAGYHEQLATKEAEIVSLAGQAEQIKAELEAVLKGSVSEKDPRIVPKYVKGYVPISFGPPSAESIGDDHLVLTNLGGSDALDVQVGDIKTGDTRATFSEIPFISSQKSEGIVANIYGFADGKKINTHFHTLDAYCKAAAEKGETSWFGRITYRGCSDDSFETVFTINYLPTKSAIELNGFRFARIPRVLPASKDSP